QTKGQLMKSLHTAFSFAPPSILSLTIFQQYKQEIIYHLYCFPFSYESTPSKEMKNQDITIL
ncbi:hypothetical protein, partial [Blautia wexlerae]|uniref:hypothetical protein n=1 Tax=Blautia wexlerae TaxID=418240 RepID=UPI001A9BE644